MWNKVSVDLEEWQSSASVWAALGLFSARFGGNSEMLRDFCQGCFGAPKVSRNKSWFCLCICRLDCNPDGVE